MSGSDEGSGSESFTEERYASSDWTPEEQLNLDQALVLYPSDQYPATLERTILVAALVPTRSAREVALRISWISSQGHVKSQDAKCRTTLPSNLPRAPSAPLAASSNKFGLRSASRATSLRQCGPAVQPSGSTSAVETFLTAITIPPPLAAPLLPSLSASCLFQSASPQTNSNSSDDACHNSTGQPRPGITAGTLSPSSEDAGQPAARASHAGGNSSEPPLVSAVQTLMEQNYSILNAFKANMQQCRVVENTELLVRLRDNIIACLGHMGSMGSPVSSMPPIPVHLNLELAGKFLPPKLMHPMLTGMPPFPFNPAMGPPPSMLMPPGMAMPPHGMMPMPMMGTPLQTGMLPPFPTSLSPPPQMALPPAAETAGGPSPTAVSRSFPVGHGMVPQNVPVSAMGGPSCVVKMEPCPAGMLPLAALQSSGGALQGPAVRPRSTGPVIKTEQ